MLCPLTLQVWFQNRRAKFRRNERAMLASKNASLLKSYSGDVTAVEQPIVPRPAPRPNDYLSWGSAAPYRYSPLEHHLIILQPHSVHKAYFEYKWNSFSQFREGLPFISNFPRNLSFFPEKGKKERKVGRV